MDDLIIFSKSNNMFSFLKKLYKLASFPAVRKRKGDGVSSGGKVAVCCHLVRKCKPELGLGKVLQYLNLILGLPVFAIIILFKLNRIKDS